MTTSLASPLSPLDDNEAFPLPVSGLFADVEDGTAAVAFTDEFLGLRSAIRARILQTWRQAITAHEQEALVEMFRQGAAAKDGQTIVQQLDQFRQDCSLHGIACPSEFAVLLQRY